MVTYYLPSDTVHPRQLEYVLTYITCKQCPPPYSNKKTQGQNIQCMKICANLEKFADTQHFIGMYTSVYKLKETNVYV